MRLQNNKFISFIFVTMLGIKNDFEITMSNPNILDNYQEAFLSQVV